MKLTFPAISEKHTAFKILHFPFSLKYIFVKFFLFSLIPLWWQKNLSFFQKLLDF